jgi:thiamine monophosphate synthase
MTRLIVISSETDHEGETSLVNDLFAEGLGMLHLRKPDWNPSSQRFFLERIDPAFLNKISVHQHHETIFEFGLKYCHMKESERTSKKRSDKKPGLKYSTSFHNYNDVQFESHLWDYCFLSPVFNSISKQNYKSTFPANFTIENDLYQRVFALGGITKNNVELVFEKGFYGAAVSGSIWNEPKNAIKNFKELNKQVTSGLAGIQSR